MAEQVINLYTGQKSFSLFDIFLKWKNKRLLSSPLNLAIFKWKAVQEYFVPFFWNRQQEDIADL